MKKVLLIAIIGMASATNGINAENFLIDGISYSALTDSTVEVVGSDELANGILEIPGTVSFQNKTYTVTGIGMKAFQNKLWLTQVSFPSTITNIEYAAFEDCGNINCPIVFPEGMTVIESSAFNNCYSIPSITLPQSIIRVGDNAFRWCHELTNLSLPASLMDIGDGAFGPCRNLVSIEVDEKNPYFKSVNGVLYNKDITTLLQAPTGIEDISIPNTVKTIKAYAFGLCNNLKSLVIPNCVKEIGYCAFEDCHNLENITLPTSMTTVTEMFYKNYGLTTLVFPDNFTKMVDSSVFLLTNLSTVKIGKGMKVMEGKPFGLCKNISLLEIEATVPPQCTGKLVEADVFNNATLVVPAGSIDAYKTASTWNQFKAIKAASEYGNNLRVEPFNLHRIKHSDPTVLPINVFNEGNDMVKSIGYTLVADGNTVTGTIENLSIPAYSSSKILVPVDLSLGQHAGSLVIGTINQLENINEVKATDWNVEVVEKVDIPEDSYEATWAHSAIVNHCGQSDLVESYEGAMRFIDPELEGYKVVGMKVDYVTGDHMKNFRIWNSSRLGEHNGEEAEAIYENGTVTGAFYNPVSIPSEGVFFGFAMDRDSEGDSGFVIPSSDGEKRMTGSLYGKLGNSGFIDWSIYGYLPLTLYLEGPAKVNSIKCVESNVTAATVKDSTLVVPITVQNYGGNSVEKIELTYILNGAVHNVTTQLENPLDKVMSRTQTAHLQLDPISQSGNYDIEITLNKVNGQPNGFTGQTCKVPVTIANFQTSHRPILEEYTGTGCGWCPRGTVGMNEMYKREPDFIGAAWHRYNVSDPMYSSVKQPFICYGAPGCQIDRNGNPSDPYWGESSVPMGIQALYDQIKNELSIADIDVESTWNATHTELIVKAKSKFAYSETGRSYKIGYLLTIDSLSHPEFGAWKQNNIYLGQTIYDPLLLPLTQEDNNDLNVFNHVVFDASCATGIDELPAQITVGAEMEASHTFVIAENTLADKELIPTEDLSKVNVIAFVIDDKGRIRNSAKARAGESSIPTAVNSIPVQTHKAAVFYDLMGHKIFNPSSGIYIKVQDGKVTKILL